MPQDQKPPKPESLNYIVDACTTFITATRARKEKGPAITAAVSTVDAIRKKLGTLCLALHDGGCSDAVPCKKKPVKKVAKKAAKKK
jgi:hypothetical protein